MKCRYCEIPGGYLFAEEKGIIKWQCYNCDSFYFYSGNNLLYIRWKTVHNKRAYLIKLYDSDTSNAPEFIVSAYSLDEWGDCYWKEIIRWNFIPRWSPLNSQEQLRKLLPFL